jgi:DNA-binding NtrC family response regulator
MRILIVDDQRSARKVLRQMLAPLPDVDLTEAASVDEAMGHVERIGFDMLLLDIRLSEDTRDRGGLDLLRKVRSAGLTVPVVMVTSMSEVSEVREAMRLGASDYVFKDELSPELLLPVIQNFRDKMILAGQVRRLREKVDETYGARAIVGSSPPMDRVRKLISRVAQSNATVLVRGETGSGKELVARAIHELSDRHDDPFIPVNCSALPGSLIESLLFGHERGAFTGADRRARGQLELAGEGTVLLDEIAEMPIDLQAKLLRVLEDRRFRPLGAEQEVPLRARVLAATHVDLEKRIAEGRFREDLFYRLNVVTIDVPALADRESDIPELIAAFTAQLSRKIRFNEPAIAWMMKRRWPGNVRELRNVVERLALLSESESIEVKTLEELARERYNVQADQEIDRLARVILSLPDKLGSKLHVIERAVLHHAIEACGGNKSAAARLIGVDRKSLERKWERLSDDKTGDE